MKYRGQEQKSNMQIKVNYDKGQLRQRSRMYRVNEGLMRKAPVFILATPRSFSTLTAILGGHPQAYSVRS